MQSCFLSVEEYNVCHEQWTVITESSRPTCKYVTIITNQPDAKSNHNPNQVYQTARCEHSTKYRPSHTSCVSREIHTRHCCLHHFYNFPLLLSHCLNCHGGIVKRYRKHVPADGPIICVMSGKCNRRFNSHYIHYVILHFKWKNADRTSDTLQTY